MTFETLSRLCAHIVEHRAFQRSIIGLIVFSAILLGIETNAEWMRDYGPEIRFLDFIVLGFFTIEILLKILAHGRNPIGYFKDGWNLIDFLIVAACFLSTGNNALAVFRLVRVLRVLRLVTTIPKLQVIVSALIRSVPSIGYVVALLILHLYMFAVMGVFLFAKNDPLHFGNLGASFLSLFQTLTLEGWADLMRIQIMGCGVWGYESFSHLCTDSYPQPVTAVIYFISFIVTGTMIFLNLLIGVVVNSMAESHQAKESPPPADEISALRLEIRQLRDELKSHR